MVGHALIYVLTSWLIAASVLLLVYLTISMANFQRILFEALCLSAQAAWLIPSVLLLSRGNALASAAGIFLIANTVRLFLSGYVPASPTLKRSGALEVRQRPAPRLTFGAMALQIGACAFWLGLPLAAAASIAVAVGIWTQAALASGWLPRRGESDPIRACSTLILATILLSWQLRSGAASNPGVQPNLVQTTNSIVRQIAQGPAPKASGRNFNATPVQTVPDGVTGVILRPKIKKSPPIPMSEPSALPRLAFSAPLAFPFTGEYHLFPTSTGSAPADSLIRQATPLEAVYSTFAGSPVETEAYQPINPPFDFSKCGQLEVTVSSGEDAPGIVSVQLLAGGEWIAAGSDMFGFATTEAIQTFRFNLPVRAPRTFEVTAIRVLFYRDPTKKSQSAKVAVVGFGLIPRR